MITRGLNVLATVIAAAIFWNSFATPEVSGSQSHAQQRPAAEKPVQIRNPEIENLIVQARSLPAEFAVDVLLRIASSNRVDKQWKQEILEEAFPIAVNAQNELREKLIPFPGAAADRRSNYRSFAFARKVDVLSMRVLIIDQMLSKDKERALRMMEQISPKLSFRAKSCSDQTMYDVADFYRLLEKITRATFDHKRIDQGERVQFLLPYIENMASPVQITPIANLLGSLNLGPKESLIVVQAFTNALKKISADDRLFTAALTTDRTTHAIFKLIQSYRKTTFQLTILWALIAFMCLGI